MTDGVVAVLPAVGWFVEHERKDGTVWQEPVVGFAMYASGAGRPLIVKPNGVIAPVIIDPGDEKTHFVTPPVGWLRDLKADEDLRVEPAVDVELTMYNALVNAGDQGVTFESLVIRTDATERAVRERVNFLRDKDLVKRTDEGRYVVCWEPARDLLRVLRSRYKRAA